MKKGTSIFILFIFLYNIVGYKALYFYQIQKAETRINEKIANSDFSNNRLITIKIPLNLPYLTDWNDFQSMEGEVVFKEKTYKYIKRKIESDSLILICIDHQEKSQIQKSSNDYFQKVNDLATDINKRPILKQAKNDFFEEFKSCDFLNVYLLLQIEATVFKASALMAVFLETNPKPPQC